MQTILIAVCCLCNDVVDVGLCIETSSDEAIAKLVKGVAHRQDKIAVVSKQEYDKCNRCMCCDCYEGEF